MNTDISIRVAALVVALYVCPNLPAYGASPAHAATHIEAPQANSIWARSNLAAWEIAPYDSKKRNSEQRAQMLQDLGISHYAYLPSRDPFGEDRENISQLDADAEIEAMQRHHIDVMSWYFWVNFENPADDMNVRKTLESFKRHHIHPNIWVAESFTYERRTPEQLAELLPEGITYPKSDEEYNKLPEVQRRTLQRIYEGVDAIVELLEIPKTQEEQKQRVQREADRIARFVRLAAPYGCKVNIYNHRNWFGMIENELAILQRLTEMGVENVGMVYNFSHSRDRFHDDSRHFQKLWRAMQPHVVAVNITGISLDGAHPLYPSQGEGEIEMMRVIQNSGWQGPIGLLGDKVGDEELTLKKTMIGLNWIAAEIQKEGSGGPRPSLPVP